MDVRYQGRYEDRDSNTDDDSGNQARNRAGNRAGNNDGSQLAAAIGLGAIAAFGFYKLYKTMSNSSKTRVVSTINECRHAVKELKSYATSVPRTSID